MGKSIKLKDLVQEGRFIHEKFNKKMNESPFVNPLIGNKPPGMPGQFINIKELIADYVIFRKEEEYSTNMEDTKEAQMQIKSFLLAIIGSILSFLLIAELILKSYSSIVSI